jgi:hypothetical protein
MLAVFSANIRSFKTFIRLHALYISRFAKPDLRTVRSTRAYSSVCAKTSDLSANCKFASSNTTRLTLRLTRVLYGHFSGASGGQ